MKNVNDAITTQDRKCGIYTIVWLNRLKRSDRTSLSITERIIGTGKKKSSLSRLIEIVLRIINANFALWNSVVKCLKPTHSLPQKPLNGLYSWKDMSRPHIGATLNIAI